MQPKAVQSFPPIIYPQPTLLILGSMPSVRSLERQEYYGHPRNHFWPLLFALAERPPLQDYGQKKLLLKECGVALWDVLASCQRLGSADASITDRRVNPISAFLHRQPTLVAVGFNGREAQKTFDRHINRQEFAHITFLELPSSSPIPTKKARNFQEKLRAWQVLRPYLRCSGSA